MLLGKKLKLIKKPDKEKEKQLREQIENEGGLEKGDMPAMIISAFLVFIPVAAVVLGLIVLLAWLFLR